MHTPNHVSMMIVSRTKGVKWIHCYSVWGHHYHKRWHSILPATHSFSEMRRPPSSWSCVFNSYNNNQAANENHRGKGVHAYNHHWKRLFGSSPDENKDLVLMDRDQASNKSIATIHNIPPDSGPASQRKRYEKEDGVDIITTSSFSSQKTTTSAPRSLRRRVRQGMGDLLAVVGFVSSSVRSIASHPRKVWDQTQRPLQAFRTFLKTSGVDLELQNYWNGRQLALNIALLARIHAQLYPEHRRPSTSTSTGPNTNKNPKSIAFWTEARRYMRYATAVYGSAMIHAVEFDVLGQMDVASRLGQVTTAAISQHVGIPEKDLVLVDVDAYSYGTRGGDYNKQAADDKDEDTYLLRHLVAVDHVNGSVVLAIRGTFSMQEIMVDIASFSRDDFCGGEAHTGMATMAERVWKTAGPTVVELLEQHADYELIVTGHSLGAGTASLLTVLLHSPASLQAHGLLGVPKSTNVRCFAYASPPTFTPLALAPKACQATVNFVHQNDVVPFLSVFSVRHLISSLRAIQTFEKPSKLSHSTNAQQQHHYKISWMEKVRMVMGSKELPRALVQAVRSAPPIVPKRGAPRLYVPAAETIWLHGMPSTTSTPSDHEDYAYESFGRRRDDGAAADIPFNVRVHPDMLIDHFPTRYEYALTHIIITGSEEDDDGELKENESQV